MKAIAFAVICAAYLLVPRSEEKRWSDDTKTINAWVFFICILGFWMNIFFEGNR